VLFIQFTIQIALKIYGILIKRESKKIMLSKKKLFILDTKN